MLVALALSAGGCGNHAGGDDGGADLAMEPMDMTIRRDLAPAADMTVTSTGIVLLADLFGTWYEAGADGGAPTELPRTHRLKTVAALPLVADDYQNSDMDPNHGCVWSRYDVQNGPMPPADEHAGAITLTGYAANLEAADITNPASFAAPFAPASTINCGYGIGALPTAYDCKFGPAQTGGLTGDYLFPLVAGAEQQPIPGGASITEKMLAGGTFSFGLTAALASPPPALHIEFINGVPPQQGDANPLAELASKFGGVDDVTVSWSCDGSGTLGGGCPTGAAGDTDLVVMLVETSLGPKSAAPSRARYGYAQCTDSSGNSTTHNVTLTATTMQQLLGSDTGQSIELSLMRVKVAPSLSGPHTVFLGAGHGEFALIDQQ